MVSSTQTKAKARQRTPQPEPQPADVPDGDDPGHDIIVYVPLRCRKCGSRRMSKYGQTVTGNGGEKEYRICKACGRLAHCHPTE